MNKQDWEDFHNYTQGELKREKRKIATTPRLELIKNINIRLFEKDLLFIQTKIDSFNNYKMV